MSPERAGNPRRGGSRTAGYRLRPTTADLAVEAWGGRKEDIFRQAARGLFRVMCDPKTVEPRETLPCRAADGNAEDLLVRWLNELIYLHEIHCFLACDVQIDRLTDTQVEGRLIGETEDRERHALGSEVKAVTLHRLKVAREPGRWRAYVILDV
ncbi:MAG: archease [Candidatus Tectomicrobia bacterium]|nr:archease [Candidatus Tectomicrobia bacterium]